MTSAVRLAALANHLAGEPAAMWLFVWEDLPTDGLSGPALAVALAPTLAEARALFPEGTARSAVTSTPPAAAVPVAASTRPQMWFTPGAAMAICRYTVDCAGSDGTWPDMVTDPDRAGTWAGPGGPAMCASTVLDDYLNEVAAGAGVPRGMAGSEPADALRVAVWPGMYGDRNVASAAAVLHYTPGSGAVWADARDTAP